MLKPIQALLFKSNGPSSLMEKKKESHSFQYHIRRIQKKTFLINVFLLVLLAILFGSILILSYVPPVSKDALVHHLTVPKLYLNHGGIYEIPFMGFSYFPMNIHLLYMIPLYFKNDMAPKYIHFGFAILTSWLIMV